jgi:hypothetical protein
LCGISGEENVVKEQSQEVDGGDWLRRKRRAFQQILKEPIARNRFA